MMKKTIIILIFVFLFSICQGVSIEKQPYEAETITGQKSVVEGNNKFALELYAKLKSAEGNLFFSPYSISTALAMTYAGARERTAGQMADVLHFPTMLEGKLNAEEKNNSMKPEQFHRAFGKIIQNMNARGTKDKYELSVANALWGQEGHEFLDEFLELVKTNYDGGLHEVDFVEASEKARQTINKWVGEKTRYKIKELIKKGVLDSMTRLVLTNAIYFKGNWARQFDEKLTKDSPFYLSELKHVQVPLMNQKGEFGYMEADDFQMLELPYVDDELSMVIVLPKEKEGVAKIEEKFTQQHPYKWLEELQKREVIVFMPKFKMTREFMLADVLKSMGIVDAFAGIADFSGMTGKKDFFISAVVHKAYVDVNEEGTEAAAATGVVMKLTAVEPPPPVFRADHPFIFIIRDKVTSSILFIGRVMNPKQ